MGVTANILPIVFDLKCKILRNETSHRLITSDNPVVEYNQLLEHKNAYGSTVGLASKGLQIFLPLSPELCLLYYDDGVYKVGRRVDMVVPMTRIGDIDELNRLQIVSTNHNVFFCEQTSKEYIEDLILSSNNYYRKKMSTVKELPVYEDKSGGKSLIVAHNEDIKTNLRLSFIEQRRRARKYVAEGKPVHIRKRRLVELAKEINRRTKEEFASGRPPRRPSNQGPHSD